MKPLNYCRQFIKQAGSGKYRADMQSEIAVVVDRVAQAEKFIVDVYGSFNDAELRALDQELELRLPFPLCALEIEVNGSRYTKQILLLEEVEVGVSIEFLVQEKGSSDWLGGYGSAFLPKTGYLWEEGGKKGVVIQYSVEEDKEWFLCAAYTVLQFLNALSCSNVRHERIEQRQPSKKSALPFDAYRVLVLGGVGAGGSGGGSHGERRAVREHVRRGHIRRLHGGRRIWINAAVVAAGIGGGLVVKDYALKKKQKDAT